MIYNVFIYIQMLFSQNNYFARYVYINVGITKPIIYILLIFIALYKYNI